MTSDPHIDLHFGAETVAFWKLFKKKSGEEMLLAGDRKGALAAFEAELKKKDELDPQLMLRVADLHNKLGNQDAAKDYYVQLGNHYGEMGFFNKSVAVFKKALNISPDDESILEALGSFNDKVPKFMVNDQLLKKKKQEEIAEPEPEIEKVEVDPEMAQTLIDFEEDTGTFQLDELEASQPAEEAAEAPEDAPAPVSSDSEDDEEEVFDLNSDDEDTSPDSEVRTRTSSGMKFTTNRVRETAAKSLAVDNNTDYNSVDDALDGLLTFGGGPAEPEPEPEPEQDHYLIPEDQFDEELDSRHWPLFRTMESDQVVEFVQALEGRDFDNNEEIVKQGDSGSEMFMIAYGLVDVMIDKDGQQLKVAELKEGDIFGEASLISGQPRNATVVAREPTNCLILNRKDLGRLSRTNREIMANLKSIYYTRIQQNAAEKQS